MEETKTVPHDYFNNDIYQWTLRMKENTWYSISNIKMEKQRFINCIIYLISCGEDLIFNNEMTKFRRIESFKQQVESMKEHTNRFVTQNGATGESLFEKSRKLQQSHKESLRSSQKEPSPFENRLK